MISRLFENNLTDFLLLLLKFVLVLDHICIIPMQMKFQMR
jgi:hypothetical protein